MNTFLTCAASLMLLFPSLSTVGTPVAEMVASAGRAELLVKLRRDPPVKDPAAVHASVGGTLIRSFEAIGWQLVRLPESMSVSEGLRKYRAHADVLAVEPNGVIDFKPPPPPRDADLEPAFRAMATTGPFTPNDPQWSSQWNMRKIGMPTAWAVTKGSSDVVVAVIDNGVDYMHEDLRENMWHNPGETGIDAEGKDKASNQMDDDQNGYVDDVFGIDTFQDDSDPMDEGVKLFGGTVSYHGTGCAGIIAATLNNRIGIAGIAGTARIMAIRVGGSDPGLEMSTKGFVTGLVEAFEYLIMQKRRGVNIRVTSNSWAWGAKSAALEDALRTLSDEGVLSVFAASNDSISNDLQWWLPVGYCLPESIAVAATDPADVLASFSNWGRSTVDLAAPGTSLPTIRTNRNYVNNFDGTSAACPHVAGAAALLLAIKPDATPLQLKAALLQSVDQVAGLRGRLISNGRLNVARVLDVLTNTVLPAVVVAAAPRSSHTDENAEIVLHFSRPVTRASVEGSLIFNPPVSGSVQWNDDSTIMTLRPSAALLRTNYSARLLGTATDSNGRTIDGDFDRSSEGSPADDFVWEFRFAPTNDEFAGATVLSGQTGSLRAGSTNSTIEWDEPLVAAQNLLGAATLWYQWQATDDGWMTFDTSSGSTLDSIVAVYTGNELAALEQVGYSEGFGSRTGGRASLPVRAGMDNFICVAGQTYWGPVDGYIGSFTLSWYPTPAPSLITLQFTPKTAMPGAKITVSGTNFTGATEVLFNGARGEFSPGLTNYADLRITATVPPDATDGPITIRTPHGDVTSSSDFVILPPPLAVTRAAEEGVEVSWPATSEAFLLERTEKLESPAWQSVDVPPGIDGRTIYRPGANSGTAFYRLRKMTDAGAN